LRTNQKGSKEHLSGPWNEIGINGTYLRAGPTYCSRIGKVTVCVTTYYGIKYGLRECKAVNASIPIITHTRIDSRNEVVEASNELNGPDS
jgi:hypothetical protein